MATHNHESNLIRVAIHEVVRLREEVAQLRQYRDHTERMLALFEGGPHHPPGMSIGGQDDFVHQLEQMAKALEVEDGLSEPPTGEASGTTGQQPIGLQGGPRDRFLR